MQPPKRYLITSALPYANGPLHIGHLAGAYLSADAYVRYLRLMGETVLFVCGSDENGAAITIQAQREGVSPVKVVEHYHGILKKSLRDIGISFDHYHRTSAPLHHKTSQEFFMTLYDKGEFVEKETEQYFDEESQQFLADRYIVGTCPKCGYENAYGDQCEHCGTTLSPTELIEPRSAITGSTPVLKKTRHWYLPLDQYEKWLDEWIETGMLDGRQLHDPERWKNHVIGQCKSWLDGGLQPRAITRDLDWGVDVPKQVEGSEGKKLYVWMDAPIGYISSTKAWAEENDTDWAPWWKDEETALIHFIGKDNIVFHCLIFPALLKAHGDFILPRNVPANQFMNLEGRKVSTSRGWAVWVHEYLKNFEGMEDVLRYYLYKMMPEQKDSEFTWRGFQDANNNELVNNLGNFINRVLVLTNKYYKGVVPEFDESISINGREESGLPTWYDSEMLDLFDDVHEMTASFRDFDFRGALKKMMKISTAGNQLLQFNEPWKQQKEDPDAVKVVMNLCLQYTVVLSIIMKPFLPFSSDKLRRMLNLEVILEGAELLHTLDQLAEGESPLPKGHTIGTPEHLFSRIDDDIIEQQLEKLHDQSVPYKAESEKEEQISNKLKKPVDFNTFEQLDLRTGVVTSAEHIPKADKLLKLEVDLGFEKRTVCSGIAEEFEPSELIGRQVVVVANLEPRKIRGIMSNGMILMAEDKTGKLTFICPDGEDWPRGAVVR